jgi:hypothetical protein
MTRRTAIAAGLFLGLALPTAAADPTKVSYRNDVWPILKRHCWGCHSSTKPKGRLSMDSMPEMRKGGRKGPLFQPGKPDESLLLEVVSGPEPSMPKNEPPLSPEKIQIFRNWVLAGARDDTPADKGLIEVKAPQTYPFAPAVTSVAFAAGGKRLAAACRSEVVLIEIDGTAPPRRLPATSDWISHVAYSPDGKLLAAAGGTPGQYGEVRFFDAATAQVVSTRRVGKDTLFRGSFSPDGKWMALGGADGAVHVIPVDAKEPVRRFELHSDWVMDVAYTPDGKMLVTGGRDKTTKIASVQTGELLRVLDTSTERIGAVAADGLFAISAGKARSLVGFELKIALDSIPAAGAATDSRPITSRGQYARDFEGQAGEVLALALSGDRKLVAAAGAFGDVRVYQIANRQRVALIPNVPAPVYAVALDAKGSRLALGTKSGLIQVYELPSGKLLKSLVPVPVVAQGVRP